MLFDFVTCFEVDPSDDMPSDSALGLFRVRPKAESAAGGETPHHLNIQFLPPALMSKMHGDFKPKCNAICQNGAKCQRMKGDCPFHADEAHRCMSAVDRNENRGCKLSRKTDSDYCEHHCDFPNLYASTMKYLLSKSRSYDLLEADVRRSFYPSTTCQLPVQFEVFLRNFFMEEECLRRHFEQ